MQFKQVIGQSAVKRKLLNMLRSGRVPHALLISGSEGTGGLPMAMAMAQYLNCENPTENDSCGICNSCQKTSKLIHPDIAFTFPTITQKSGDKPISNDFIREWRNTVLQNPYITYNQWLDAIGADTKQGNITAYECQEIIRRINLKSYEAKYKVQIIWLAELLRETGNVLLKSIEEPPPNTMFLLVAEQTELILPTILSRTQQLRLPPIDVNDIQTALENVLDFERKHQAAEIANLAGGSWVNALDVMNSDEMESEQLFLSWMRICAVSFNAQNIAGLPAWVESFQELGREKQKLLLRYGLMFIENSIAEQTNQTNRLSNAALEASKKIAARYSHLHLYAIQESLNQFHYHIERNANAKIAALSHSLKIADAFKLS